MISHPDNSAAKKVLVDTFTGYAFIVFEVNREERIINAWSKDAEVQQQARDQYIGQLVTDTPNEWIDESVPGVIRRTFTTAESQLTHQTVVHKNRSLKTAIRILPNVLDADAVFVVVENTGSEPGMPEDKWKAALESERLFNALFNYSEAMICTHDTNGIITSVNPFTSKALGYSREEMIGTPISYLIPEYLRSRFNAEYLEKVRTEGKAEGIMRVISKTGEKRYLLYHNHLFENEGSKPYVIGFAQDITDRVIAEEALKSSMDTFSSVFNHSGIGIALLNTDGKWLDANPVVCSITGYEKQELLQMNFRDITHEEDVVKDLMEMRQILERKTETYTREKRYLTKKGEIKWVSVTVSLVWKNSDTPAFFIAQLIDITQQKMLRDEIDRQKIALEHSQGSLIEKVKQLEEMSHIVAHNLRGPANNIKLLSETLKIKLGFESDNENAQIISESVTEAESADMIGKASDSLLHTLELLLSIAEIRLSGKIEFDHCNISEVVKTIQQQLQGNILESKAIINTYLDVPYVEYPKHYLENIFYNLISNAIKYRREGVSPEISILSEQQDGKTLIRVKDNGSGLDMEKFGKKLFRLNQVFHRNKDSKGIGLFLVRNQVESLGGKIQATSKVNEGSEFVVTL